MKKIRYNISILIGFHFSSLLHATDNPLQIENIRPSIIGTNEIIEITTNTLLPKNTEILADYGDNTVYKLEIITQKENKLYTRIVDIGKNLNINILVKSGKQKSSYHSLKIQPDIISTNSFPKKHNKLLGEKGIDIFNIKNQTALCKQNGELFHHAEIIFIRRQFAGANIIDYPKKNCQQCKSLKVKWYNEPTGELIYKIRFNKRKISGICQSLITNS